MDVPRLPRLRVGFRLVRRERRPSRHSEISPTSREIRSLGTVVERRGEVVEGFQIASLSGTIRDDGDDSRTDQSDTATTLVEEVQAEVPSLEPVDDNVFLYRLSDVRLAGKVANSHQDKKLLNEIEAYRKLQVHEHKSIPVLLAEPDKNSPSTLHLEWMENGSVRYQMQHDPKRGKKYLRRWAREATSAIAWLHSLGFIWNGCSARHVLLDAEFHAKISGFGLSRVMQRDTADIGTELCRDDCQSQLRWMAPEVITHSKCWQSSDIWSLGCFVVEMVTGKDPHIVTEYDSGPAIPQIKGLQVERSPRGLSDFLDCTFVTPHDRRLPAKYLQKHQFLIKQKQKGRCGFCVEGD